jgi:uncharacterized protein (DUF1697 family)
MQSYQDFRRIALWMKDAVESAHMGHPDFRTGGRIFATLHSDNRCGMVKLTPDQQQDFVRRAPASFVPENGAWGRQGCTRVHLNAVDEDTLGEAITLAWQNIASRGATPRAGHRRTAGPARPRQKAATVHVALLRGVNVGGRNILPMQDLAAMFRDAGCGDVRTYIQSGNVLFTADAKLVGRVQALISAAVSARFGFAVKLMTRSAAELADVVAHNPFLKEGTDTKTLHVAFLADRPSRSAVATLDPHRSPPDQFAVRGREIYLRCPAGAGSSKLTTQYFDSRLKTTSTARNWNTVVKLLELARGG